MKLTNNFSLSEFLSKGDDEAPSEEVIRNLTYLANRLQVLRDILERKININSGFRSPEYNKSIGGASNSYHIKGMAADIVVEGMSPAKVQQYLVNWSGGLGSYKTFTHVDIRETNGRWEG